MHVNKKWLLIVIGHYILSVLLILLNVIGFISKSVCGLFSMIILIPIIAKIFKENKLFSPLTPNIVFDVSYSAYLLDMVTLYRPISVNSLLLIISCSFIWKLSVITSKGFISNVRPEKIKAQQINRTQFTFFISCLFILSVSNMIFEWQMAGGVPALRSDVETFRFTVSFSSITHLLAIMNKVVAALIGVYLINKEKISFKKDILLILEMLISELLMIGTSMRGEMIMAPCIIFIVYAIKKKLPLKVYVVGGVSFLAIVGFLPLFRMIQNYGISYVNDLKGISRYPKLYWLTPLYQTFTNNFDILNLDFSIFPEMRNYGFGVYSILPMIPFVDLGSSVAGVQNEVLHNGFYSALTATYLASWYADFGWFGCMFITAVYAKLTSYAYSHYLKERNLFSLVWYAYTFYSALWLTYATVFDIVYVIYSFVMWIVLKMRVGTD